MARLTLAISLLALLAFDVKAQTSKNVQLLGRFHPSSGYNDIWGYRNPANGKEYALLGTTTGLYIVDVSVPSRPVQRGFMRTRSGSGPV